MGLSVGVLWVGVAGCTAKSGGQSAATTPPGAATTPPTTPATGEEGVGTSAPVLADGRHPVYLTGLDLAKRQVTFDLIQFLTGKAAKEAWVKAHPEEPDGPPNDYMIINDNPRLRTLPIDASVAVTVVDLSDGVKSVPVALADLPAWLAAHEPVDAGEKRLSYNPWWLTVAQGKVTKIDEQFVP